MEKLKLPNVTLLGIDCANVKRLQLAMDICQKDIEFGTAKLLTSLPSDDPRLVSILHIDTIQEYSEFCVKELYKYVETDYVLLVQYDGFVLDINSWDGEFLEYDYIGAPWNVAEWAVKDFDFPESLLGTRLVGNGGFSLRSKRFLELSAKFVEENKIKKLHPEDVALCVWSRDLFIKEGIKFAPPDLGVKFSVEDEYGEYVSSFGFHGLYRKNMDHLLKFHPDFPIYTFLPRLRTKKLKVIGEVFENIALEGHVFGSVGRGDGDDLSDLDVWLTFKDEDFASILKDRINLYGQIGDIVHICEPHQNAPINGIFSTVLYKTKVGLLVVDYYLCPKSTAFITNESKKLFGDITELPMGQSSLNPQKVTVTDSYRIDFFICFIFNSIKKLWRKKENALGNLFKEYEYLSMRYGIPVEPIENRDNTFRSLLEIIEKTNKISNEKQKDALAEITKFIRQVQV